MRKFSQLQLQIFDFLEPTSVQEAFKKILYKHVTECQHFESQYSKFFLINE